MKLLANLTIFLIDTLMILTLIFFKMKIYILTIAIVFCFISCNNNHDKNKNQEHIKGETESETYKGYDEKILKLIQQKKAFEPGSYTKTQIPKGLLVFVSETGGYYSEEVNGQIIDNEIFDSFGYVYNQGLGDIETQGLLIKYENFNETGFDSPKSYYENITKQKNYNFSGMYKVGVDITPGKYILESVGEGYLEVNKGAVGNSQIIRNDNFNGRKTVSLKSGEYLKLSNVKIIFE